MSGRLIKYDSCVEHRIGFFFYLVQNLCILKNRSADLHVKKGIILIVAVNKHGVNWLKLIHVLCYLLTPWSRVHLKKLTGFAANQEFPRILWNPKVHYRTHKRQPPVQFWANPIQFAQPLPTFWRSILILSSHLRLGLPNG